MSLDQQLDGCTDWHFPSPTSTPKSLTFPDPSSLKTPKTEAFPPSYFLDAWATPNVNAGQQTPAQTPCFTLSTPSTSYSPQVRTPEDPEFHVNHFIGPSLALPPVEPARRLSSSPDPHRLKHAIFDSGDSHALRPRPLSMDTSQMQTPPPTRHATSRRSLQLQQQQQQQQQQQNDSNDTIVVATPRNNTIAVATPRNDTIAVATPRNDTIAVATPSNDTIVVATPRTVIHRTPAQMPSMDDGLFGQTPMGFTALQFSPDMTHDFSNTGPMSAPLLLPQSRLFWDQPNSGTHMDVDVPLTHDLFGPTPHKMEGSLDWANFQNTPTANNTLNSQSFQALHDMTSQSGPMDSFAFSSAYGDDSGSGSFMSTAGGVDPNMLFSFSSQGPSASFDTSLHMPSKTFANRQPYEKQLEDSLSEREAVRRSRSQHSRTSTNSSSSTAASRPNLQRSNTDSGPRKPRPVSMDSRVPGPAASYNIPRRSSPLKRQSGGSLKSIPEIRRPKTRLVIDENGRARTETIPAGMAETTGGGEPRRSSEQDLRRQYPGLWADDDSDSDDEPTTLSRNTSLNMPRRRTSKHARIDHDDLIRSDSFKMPRSSSRPSSGAFDQSSFETIRPSRRAAENPNRRFSMMDFPTSFGDGHGNQDLPMPDSPGDALGALKRVVEGRHKKTDNSAQSTLRAHNQRWAQASADFASANALYDPFSTSFSASPSNSAETGLTTPSTDRSSLSGDSVRCVCNGGDDGVTMIQCESCTKWLHMGCVGLTQNKVPPVYVCVYCTGQTPVARGGRVRGPVPAPFDSPLTHKSIFRR
ncbi:unnamed protein product [Periconia digitata]|uniref:Zinc finger PHD-type domain-containing protein n=1 Tax=Periconia digitata TaxID=1303443 RepID=A0A9W4UL95_9PLEO|nr:unnamed protein product [Periconia digitata]